MSDSHHKRCGNPAVRNWKAKASGWFFLAGLSTLSSF